MDARVDLTLAAAAVLVACGGPAPPAAPIGHAAPPRAATAPTSAWLGELVQASAVVAPPAPDLDGFGCGGRVLGEFVGDHMYMMSMGEGGTSIESACEGADADGWRCRSTLVAPPCPRDVDGCAPFALVIHYQLDADRAIVAGSVRCAAAPR
ncbi:MAG: hypothetical protein R2939_08135 [Kofleriaceae bacterium]